MRTASQLRQIARQRLDGKWGTSLVVSLLAALLGCYGTYFTVSYSVDSTGELFDGQRLTLQRFSAPCSARIWKYLCRC